MNRRLSASPATSGSVANVDLALVRGLLRIDGLEIHAREARGAFEAFTARRVSLNLEWRELVRGRLVARATAQSPVLRLARPEVPPPATDGDWRRRVRELMPITLTRVDLENGTFAFVDPTGDEPVEIVLVGVRATIRELSNRAPCVGKTPTEAELAASLAGGGRLCLKARAAPLASPPRFEAQLELEDVDLPALNPLLRRAASVDVSEGKLQIAAEVSAADGEYEGYLKPLVRGARFDPLEDGDGFFKSVWESLVGATTAAFTNSDTEKAGTKVPFAGRFDQREVGAWTAFLTLLRNAFGEALRGGVDGEIDTP